MDDGPSRMSESDHRLHPGPHRLEYTPPLRPRRRAIARTHRRTDLNPPAQASAGSTCDHSPTTFQRDGIAHRSAMAPLVAEGRAGRYAGTPHLDQAQLSQVRSRLATSGHVDPRSVERPRRTTPRRPWRLDGPSTPPAYDDMGHCCSRPLGREARHGDLEFGCRRQRGPTRYSHHRFFEMRHRPTTSRALRGAR